MLEQKERGKKNWQGSGTNKTDDRWFELERN